jgi:hypothetical protein
VVSGVVCGDDGGSFFALWFVLRRYSDGSIGGFFGEQAVSLVVMIVGHMDCKVIVRLEVDGVLTLFDVLSAGVPGVVRDDFVVAVCELGECGRWHPAFGLDPTTVGGILDNCFGRDSVGVAVDLDS